MARGLLYSQIGYDYRECARAFFRTDEKEALSDTAVFLLCGEDENDIALRKPVRYCGSIWGSHFWELDFSEVSFPGRYRIHLRDGDGLVATSGMFDIAPSLLWERTFTAVAAEAFEERAALARNGGGFKDCGHYWREVSSHYPALIGFCDTLTQCQEWMPPGVPARLQALLATGCDYLCRCKEAAEAFGLPKGSVVHELPSSMTVLPGNCAGTALVLAKASRLLFESYPERARQYHSYATDIMEYINGKMTPYHKGKPDAKLHGLKDQRPEGFMTRDLLLFAWAALELVICGHTEYEKQLFEYVRQILGRQIPKEKAEDGLYGHFYTFDSPAVSEKSFIHYGVGHDTGGVLPHYIIPLIELCRRYAKHPLRPAWRKCIEDFAYGYFLPACEANPYCILPVGWYENEGLLNFCGPWHGFNVTFCFAATLAFELYNLTKEPRFRHIGTSHLQWIAGLHTGLSSSSCDSNMFFRPEIPEGVYLPYSQIEGLGERSIRGWCGIRGTIPNGFCRNKQFCTDAPISKAEDKPLYYTDEDWIPHSGGYISALSHLKTIQFFDR